MSSSDRNDVGKNTYCDDQLPQLLHDAHERRPARPEEMLCEPRLVLAKSMSDGLEDLHDAPPGAAQRKEEGSVASWRVPKTWERNAIR
jgi:hypothetical protein